MAPLTQDIAEIAHLLKLERFHRDTGQWEQCRAAFHPDNSKTHVDVAWFVLSPDRSQPHELTLCPGISAASTTFWHGRQKHGRER